jgi:hypothetical protein
MIPFTRYRGLLCETDLAEVLQIGRRKVMGSHLTINRCWPSVGPIGVESALRNKSLSLLSALI